MKTGLLIIFAIGIIGFMGFTFAEESPGSPIPEPEEESFTYTNCGPGTTYQDGICVVDEIENSVKPSSGKWDAIQSIDQISNSDVIPSPLKQMKLGIKLGHVICDKDKSSVVNIHYKPACVYSNSESELIKRGWAKLRLLLPAGPDPIKELDWMGRNVMSMMLEGTFSYNSTPVETLDEKRAAIWEYSQQYHPGEQYLEYAIIPHQNHYNVGDKVQFDLLEWGNYQDCWDLKLRIIDRHDESVYEDNSVRYCLEPDGKPGMFHSYSMGKQFDEFVCDKPGYYRIEVSNGNVFSPTILQNFACLVPELIPEPAPTSTSHRNLIDARNKLGEIYNLDSSLGPFNIKDAIVGYGTGDGFLIVDILEKFYDSEKDRQLIMQKIIDITGGNVDIEFNSSGAIAPTNIEFVFPYVWNEFLHRNDIEFTPKEQSYVNTDIGYERQNRVCSPIIASNGTEFYISSIFTYEPFEITGTFIDKIMPDDCYKVWKTDTILVEPDRILMLWLENYREDN